MLGPSPDRALDSGMDAMQKGFMLVAALAFAVATGYLTAWSHLDDCADEALRRVEEDGVTGLDMRGRDVQVMREDVVSFIAGPFLVDTQLLVPHDLHGSIHSTRFLVLPWGFHRLSDEVVDLVLEQRHHTHGAGRALA